MPGFLDLLAQNNLLLLFTIIGLGYLIGNISIFGFKLGVAALLFVGIAFSAIDPRLILPEHIYIIGLVLFVYAIGLQAGPGFFASFHKRGLRMSLIAVAILVSSAALAGVLGKVFGFSAATIAGLFCGSLTNTPALAAAVEAVKNMGPSLPPDRVEYYVNSPVVAYGLAYPIGVLGAIFWITVLSKAFRVDFKRETAAREKESEAEQIVSRTFRVSNPAIVGMTIERFMATIEDPDFVLSRIKKGETIEVANPDTVLAANDLVIAVGPARALRAAHLYLGEESQEKIAARRDDTAYRWYFVSERPVVGRTISELQKQRPFVGAITRLRRNDVEFVPSPSTTLEMGDRILVVSPRQEIERITDFFGDSLKALSETDYLSLSLGIVLGVFLGMAPIPLPNGTSFKLGFAGGPLIVGLILGRLERTGRIQWGLPYNANLVLRQIGLVFFLAAIGTKAGLGLMETIQSGAIGMIVVALAIVSFVSVSVLVVAHKRLGLPMSAAMGMLAGVQTQPACLAYANQQAQNDLPNLWYAPVQPASMIAKIILAQVIVTTLLL
ncbi:MAG TPA: TrkA C-terminal domain-containing protein [bacterium]|nr:TrkA C-terminal domain-containing protein [bacterium]